MWDFYFLFWSGCYCCTHPNAIVKTQAFSNISSISCYWSWHVDIAPLLTHRPYPTIHANSDEWFGLRCRQNPIVSLRRASLSSILNAGPQSPLFDVYFQIFIVSLLIGLHYSCLVFISVASLAQDHIDFAPSPSSFPELAHSLHSLLKKKSVEVTSSGSAIYLLASERGREKRKSFLLHFYERLLPLKQWTFSTRAKAVWLHDWLTAHVNLPAPMT